MRPVPPIDSVYYEKRTIVEGDKYTKKQEGCQIYLNTHDPERNCKFYRWEYIETWEFMLPYSVPNYRCWVSSNSDKINVENTSSFTDDRIERFPINYITNATDRLAIKYSMLENQYSVSENEYLYWDKLRTIVEQVGSLYDITPASIPSNITCVEKPDENVLGYFSVSSVRSKRIFILELVQGMPNLYSDCENVIVGYNDSIPGLLESKQ